MPIEVTRKELYDQVWARPMIKVGVDESQVGKLTESSSHIVTSSVSIHHARLA